MKICRYEQVMCGHPGCEEMLLRKDLQSHMDSNCEWGTMECTFCSESVVKNSFTVSCNSVKKSLIYFVQEFD